MSTFHQCSSGVHEAEIARLTAERDAAVARAGAAEAALERVRELVADPPVILNVREIALRYARVRAALDGGQQ